MGKRFYTHKPTLRQVRKLLINSFNQKLIFNPYSFIKEFIKTIPEKLSDYFKLVFETIINTICLFLMIAFLLTFPICLPLIVIYKTIIKVYYRLCNIRYVKKCGGVFKVYEKLCEK